MEIVSFIAQLKSELLVLDFVEKIVVEQKSISYIKLKVILKPKGFLSIWYNAITRTQSFSIILDNERKWGFDFDNRIAWHEHPVENPDQHIPASNKSISEIISSLKEVWEIL